MNIIRTFTLSCLILTSFSCGSSSESQLTEDSGFTIPTGKFTIKVDYPSIVQGDTGSGMGWGQVSSAGFSLSSSKILGEAPCEVQVTGFQGATSDTGYTSYDIPKNWNLCAWVKQLEELFADGSSQKGHPRGGQVNISKSGSELQSVSFQSPESGSFWIGFGGQGAPQASQSSFAQPGVYQDSYENEGFTPGSTDYQYQNAGIPPNAQVAPDGSYYEDPYGSETYAQNEGQGSQNGTVISDPYAGESDNQEVFFIE